MKGILFFITLFFFFIQHVVAQTILNKGDIVVVGYNANDCATVRVGTENIEVTDRVYFVSFKPITSNTVISITDNGYERNSSNSFAISEGVMKMLYKGQTIPAGKVFAINFHNNTTSNISRTQTNKLNPDWKIEYPFNTVVNLNTSGDQLFVFFNNNEFDNSTSVFAGNVIYAFNTKSTWNANATPGANNSNLPGNQSNAPLRFNILNYHLTNLATRDYNYFNENIDNLSKSEWLLRLLNPNYYRNENIPCNQFNTDFQLQAITIKTQNPRIEVCQGDVYEIAVDNNNMPGLTFQWYSNTSFSDTGGTAIAGATQYKYSIPTNVSKDYYYYCEMTYKLSNQIPNTTNTLKSLPFRVKVNPLPTIAPIEMN
ncbi:hypothetical protein [Empedobacter brevis]|uniref:hypothetical protein n=1 Tax=Empedobacter brevis TaxID=247 RepID=UPI002FE09027